MIPKHRCTAYCEPEEGVHCLPNRGYPGYTLEGFQRTFAGIFDIIKIQEESDVTSKVVYQSMPEMDHGLHYEDDDPNFVGYLIWMQEIKN